MSPACLFARWQSLPALVRVRWLLGLSLIAVTLFLLVADKPWAVDWAALTKPAVKDYVRVFSWWGGVVAWASLGFLGLTSGWWMRPLPATDGSADGVETGTGRVKAPNWFWPWVMAAMMITMILGAQRLNFSLWDDEEYTLRRFVVGGYEQREDGGVEFKKARWERTFHNYQMPNNHILHSVLARISHGTWSLLGGGREIPFSELALRLPAYLFGILSIASLAWLLLQLGLPRAGVMAAFLMALHPWHVRYASEARGYSLVLCLLPILLVFWMRALRSSEWRWWLGYGAVSFALLYAYPAMLYLLILANVLALAFILFRLPLKVSPVVPLGRWFAANVLAGSAFIWLYLPCVPQLLKYLESTVGGIQMGRWWEQNFLAYLFSGVSWFKSKDLLSPQPELAALAGQQPLLFQALTVGVLFLLLAGFLRLVSRGMITAAVALLLILPAIAAYGIALRSGAFLFEWYLIYLLPGVVALVAVGFDSLDLPLRRFRSVRILVPAALVLFVTFYLRLTSEVHAWLLTRPIQPIKESALLVRGTTRPNYEGHDRILTASFNAPAFLYDPHLIRLQSVEDMRALMDRAEEEDIPLYLNVGNPWAASFHHPEMYQLMTESDQFEVVARLPGLDPTLDRVVARYRPGSSHQVKTDAFP